MLIPRSRFAWQVNAQCDLGFPVTHLQRKASGLTSAALRHSGAMSLNEKFVGAVDATRCVYFATESSGL